jgi:3-phosphoshikimate 1-carboxyvinyltransferase
VTDHFRVPSISSPLAAAIQPPGSKSITNRALVCAALAQGPSRLNGTLASEDTLVMIQSLRKLGVSIEPGPAGTTLTVSPAKPIETRHELDLDVANSGTTIRFLAALLATQPGHYRLDGTDRMRERPAQDLLDALGQLGVRGESTHGNGCPPIVIDTEGLPGGKAQIRGDISSQFLSGLLMAAPFAQSTVTLQLDTPLVSVPYVTMTERVMEAFGVHVTHPTDTAYQVETGQAYQGATYNIEPDASAASYFWAAAAIAGGHVTVQGLTRDALQGDVAFCECLRVMGCGVQYMADGIKVTGGSLQGVTVDMNTISDTVQTLAVVALFADGPTTITNVAHIRHKESDRIGDLARELRKLGGTIHEHEDGLTIEPATLHPAEIETYQDHRMAMSLALAGLRVDGVMIKDPGCTEKTYPGFFTDLQSVLTQQAAG